VVELALLTYSYVEDMASRREPHRDGHLALITEYADAGRLFMAGAIGDPPAGGALVFADATAAEEFVDADPYMAAGLVPEHSVSPYKVVSSKPVPGV
jgi:uncharacterized protein YciI